MMTRARFVTLGAVVVAIVLFAPELARRTFAPVPTAHQPALMLSFDPHQIDDVTGLVRALDGVRAVDLELRDAGARAKPDISGTVQYHGFMLSWQPEDRFAGFDTVVRPYKPRLSSEPAAERIDRAMQDLESLFLGLDHGTGLFITDAEMRGSRRGPER